MNLFSKMFLNAICVTAFIGQADGSPPISALAEHGWFCDRGIRDPGPAQETALYLKVDADNTNAREFNGTLYVYKRRGGRHDLHRTLDVYGEWNLPRKPKRRSTKLYVGEGEVKTQIGALTYWYDRKELGGNQYRVVIRLVRPSGGRLATDTTDCDDPPDDDMLEEEPIIDDPPEDFPDAEDATEEDPYPWP